MISLFYIAYLVCVSSFSIPELVSLNPINQSLLATGCSDLVVTSWDTNEDACPCGTQIMDWDHCEKAAAWLGKQIPSRSTRFRGSRSSKDPKGCIWRIDNDVLFNHAEGSRHKLTGGDRERALVCASHAVLRLGGRAIQCNDGEVQVESAEDCERAAQSLGIAYTGLSGNRKEPCGCINRIPDGDIKFSTNAHCPTGKLSGGWRQLVCVTAPTVALLPFV